MDDFKLWRIGLQDQRALEAIANEANYEVVLMKSGDNDDEAPPHVRRQGLR